jgi:1,3-beta-glucan synthase
MSGHQQGHYDDGYGHQQHGNTDSYYQDEQAQYYDHNGGYEEHGHGGDGYYDEA